MREGLLVNQDESEWDFVLGVNLTVRTCCGIRFFTNGLLTH